MSHILLAHGTQMKRHILLIHCTQMKRVKYLKYDVSNEVGIFLKEFLSDTWK